MLGAIVRLLRVKHWLKNVLVFFPVVFGGALLSPEPMLSSCMGFASLCLAASGVYVVNDIRDVEADRAHPVKRRRPIASGEVPVGVAKVLAAILFVAGLVLSALAVPGDPLPPLCLTAYIALNLAYSMGAKNVAIVDVAILAAGYYLRVLLGSLVTGIEMSSWLYLTVISLSFYLGLGKRRGELEASGGDPVRRVLREYPADFLSSSMNVFFTLGLVFYSLWASDSVTVARTSGYMMATVPIVFLICLRYSLIMGRKGQGDPVEVVFSDKALLCLLAVFAVAAVVIVYAG